jgi:hypothetical protein
MIFQIHIITLKPVLSSKNMFDLFFQMEELFDFLVDEVGRAGPTVARVRTQVRLHNLFLTLLFFSRILYYLVSIKISFVNSSKLAGKLK